LKKIYFKRILSLVMVMLLVFPVLVSASSPSSVIKKIYFQDEAGNMVFANYEEAINQSINGNNTLYNGIIHHVGIAEAKGKSLYLETNTQKILDFKLAMMDNSFRLEQIIDNPKYKISHEITWTHELKVVEGKVVIAPKTVDTSYTINIVGPKTLKISEKGNFDVRAYGDGKGNKNYTAKYDYKITGGTGKLEYLDGSNWREIPLSGCFGPNNGFTLTPNWDATTKLRFTPNIEGTYSLDFTLKDLDANKTLANAGHILTVSNILNWPIEVENVFVGKSLITNKTYANIEIKAGYISLVKKVYVDNILANNMVEKPSQWRIEVQDGTTVEQLRGRVNVGTENPLPGAKVNVEVRNSSDFLPALIQLKVGVQNIPNSAKYDVVYQLSGGEGSNTAKFDLGTWTTESIFFNPKTITDKITVRIYDASGDVLLHTFTDVVIVNPMIPK